MFGIESLGSSAQAVVLVGIVLAEAIVLYLGYALLERAIRPAIERVVRGVE